MPLKKRRTYLLKHIDPCYIDKHHTEYAKVRQLITGAATQLAFSPDNALNLHDHGLTPRTSLSTDQSINKTIETIMPVLREKAIRWPIDSTASDKEISTLFLKLGTGNRVNHCQLVLNLLDRTSHQVLAKASIAGATVQDNQWTPFPLNRSLPPDTYFCQVCSPDADNQNNTLFLWLTLALTEDIALLPDRLLDLYHYGLTPVIRFPMTTTPHTAQHISVPLLRENTLQWYITVSGEPISSIFLKLGSGGHKKKCHLVLSCFKAVGTCLILVATARIVGMEVQDARWNTFKLSAPLPPGDYVCRLQSPDTDNTTHTLFLWLTTYGLAHYRYTILAKQTLQATTRQSYPVISLILVAPAATRYLSACLESIAKQVYLRWELCVVTDAALIRAYHDDFSERIRLIPPQTPDPYNAALAATTGEYLVCLHPDDLLTETALLTMAQHIVDSDAPVDMLYSDEDKVNNQGLFDEPYFKPDWSSYTLKGCFYTGQLSVYRTERVKAVGGFRPIPATKIRHLDWLRKVYDLRQDHDGLLWDLTLKLAKQAQRVIHIPEILYHRRRQPTLFIDHKAAFESLQTALTQENLGGYATPQTQFSTTAYLVHYVPQQHPLVSFIIPTKDMAATLATCIDAIKNKTTYKNWEIIVVDNNSQAVTTFELFERYQAELGTAFKVCQHNAPFNFSTLVNRGVETAQGEIIFLLNNDTEVITPPQWLEEMIGFAQQPAIGCVGCKLLYPQDNTIQHAGLICGIGGIANYSHKHFSSCEPGYFDRLAVVSQYAAVTGACLMVERTLWDKVNGFDENLAVAFNDVDFCLKLLALGFQHVVLPHVMLYHHESKSRGLEDTTSKQRRLAQETRYMEQRWSTVLWEDPFYNPHLTRYTEDFALNPNSAYFSSDKFSIQKLFQAFRNIFKKG